MSESPRVVPCPLCGKTVPWTPTSTFRPFCSERCRNIDLGAWASESYRIAVKGDPAGDSERGADTPRDDEG
ncbi:MAG: DNA gyrase inhibitor YacG [Proteobacteria bacterium]|nr:DNA gyrase inhibitor YacG [Pseudomonadota bacterium]